MHLGSISQLSWSISSNLHPNDHNIQHHTFINLLSYNVFRGAVCWGVALQAGRSWFRFSMVWLEYFLHITLSAALWSWDRLSLWQKWVLGLFRRRSKGGRCVGMTTLPPFMIGLSWNVVLPSSLNHHVLSRIALPLQRGLVVEWNDWARLRGSKVLHSGVVWIEC